MSKLLSFYLYTKLCHFSTHLWKYNSYTDDLALNLPHQHAQFFDYCLSFFPVDLSLDLPSYEPLPVGVSAV